MPSPVLRREVQPSPFQRLARWLHLVRADGTVRVRLLVALTWIPLCVGALLYMLHGDGPQPLILDISVHVRLLVVIPLLLAGEQLLDRRCQSAITQLYKGSFADRRDLDPIVTRAERLRRSRIAEVALLVMAVLAGQGSLWGLTSSVVSGIDHTGPMSFARVWYSLVALPVAQFLLFRWVWHWVIWSYVVIHVSRKKLATIATHPDHAGGIGFLGGPISGFSFFALACSALLASAWATQLMGGRATVPGLVPGLILFAFAMVFVGCGPLLAYVPVLYRARRTGIFRFNALALEYVRAFDQRWIDAREPGRPLLGTSDLQSLADLGNSYASLVQIRRVPFGPRLIQDIVVGVMVPMLPLIGFWMPLTDLLVKIGRVLVGGLL